jgi:hypothetical protein
VYSFEKKTGVFSIVDESSLQVCDCILDQNCFRFIDHSVSYDDFPHDSSADIVGKWLLVRSVHYVSDVFAGQYEKLCQNSIVYEFKPNGVLTVSKDTPTLQNFLSADDYPYFVNNFAMSASLFISTTSPSYFLKTTSEKMIIHIWSPFTTDSFSYHFEKI